ncbi:disrupted in schizophrenia 1 protein isoform X2 [Panthera leo]|uniref:disrupted in schizophrenia 1 protein isoform X2 n=1 Tax=Panthera leo TaxID=9689 RepID=UPI001C6A29A2|nr:disrupted in schizophrenia 1 protein isoform X2 [Panthera leo]
MLGGGPQGAPAGGGGGHCAGSRDCLPPAASFRRRRLARRPGYMRGTAGPRIGFLYPAVATPLRAQGAACGEESLQSESRARHCGLELGGQWRGPSVGSPAASSLTIVGHPGLALTAVRGPSGLFGIQLRADTKLPARLTRSCGPGDTGWQGALPPMDSSEAPGPGREAAGGERAKGTWTKGCLSSEEGNGSRYNLESGPRVPSAPAASQDGFTSSFSFIRLSLSSAGERGEAEGCPPSRDAEAPCQSPVETEAKDASLDRPHAHPRLLSPHFNVKAAQSLADPAQMAAGSPRLECETRSLPDVDTASSCPLVPSWSEGSGVGDAPRWETLLRRCEPVLLDCLLSDQRQLEPRRSDTDWKSWRRRKAAHTSSFLRGSRPSAASWATWTHRPRQPCATGPPSWPAVTAPKPCSEWSQSSSNPLPRTPCMCPSPDETGFFKKSSSCRKKSKLSKQECLCWKQKMSN